MGPLGLSASVIVSAGALLVFAPGAHAAVGDLTFAGCLTQSQMNGCTDIAGVAEPLDSVNGVAVSPDGRDVYVTATESDAVSHFRRDAGTGELDFADCWARAAFGCRQPTGATASLDGAHSVAIAADGADLYTSSIDGDTLAHFSRDPESGALEFGECFGPAGVGEGCTDLAVAALDGSHAVVVSADGADVYAVAQLANALLHFSRAIDGTLEFEDCHAEGISGCTETAAEGGGAVDALSDPHWIATSADGLSVYVAAVNSDAVADFSRDPADGSLEFAGCVGDSAGGGCVDAPAESLNGVHSVVVSQDNRNVYTASQWSSAVTVFRRDPSGGLTFAGCLAEGATGCVDLRPAQPLFFDHVVSVSDDGRSVYSGGLVADAVAHFTRDPGAGALTMSSCIGQGTPGCADLSPTLPLDGFDHIAVSPDGADAYATSYLSDSVAHFRRELPASNDHPGAPSGPPTPQPLPKPVARGARISRRSLSMGRSGRVRVVVACPSGGPDCNGRLTIRRAQTPAAAERAAVLLGERRFTARAGSRRSVTVRLSRRARELVRRARRLRVRVAVRVPGAPATRRLLLLRAGR